MLDSNFEARLGDFGLARALQSERNSYTAAEGVVGIRGYVAPECFLTGKATQQSDIYEFGAVHLEAVCGLRPGARIEEIESLVDWVWRLYREGRLLEAVDQKIRLEFEEEEVRRVLLLGLACSHPLAGERPTSQAIVQIISGLMMVPNIPPFKPSFIWPSTPMEDEASCMTTTFGMGSLTGR